MTAIPLGNGPGFTTNDASVSTGLRQDATYQKSLKTHSQKLSLNLIIIIIKMILNCPIGIASSTLDNSSNQNLYNFKFDYSQPIKFSDEGKLSLVVCMKSYF
jgi:hypothetical protein